MVPKVSSYDQREQGETRTWRQDGQACDLRSLSANFQRASVMKAMEPGYPLLLCALMSGTPPVFGGQTMLAPCSHLFALEYMKIVIDKTRISFLNSWLAILYINAKQNF